MQYLMIIAYLQLEMLRGLIILICIEGLALQCQSQRTVCKVTGLILARVYVKCDFCRHGILCVWMGSCSATCAGGDDHALIWKQNLLTLLMKYI